MYSYKQRLFCSLRVLRLRHPYSLRINGYILDLHGISRAQLQHHNQKRGSCVSVLKGGTTISLCMDFYKCKCMV